MAKNLPSSDLCNETARTIVMRSNNPKGKYDVCGLVLEK